MDEQLIPCRPVERVLGEQLARERDKPLRELDLAERRLGIQDLMDQLVERLRREGRRAVRELEERAAQRPQIGRERMDAVLHEELGRHVVRRAAPSLVSLAPVGTRRASPKSLSLTMPYSSTSTCARERGRGRESVSERARAQKSRARARPRTRCAHVGRLEVAVEHAVGVEVVEARGHEIEPEERDGRLGEPAGLA